MENLTSVSMREMESRSNAWLAANNGVLEGVASSPTIMFSHISQRNVDSMIWVNIGAISLITIVLLISLRSIRFGLLSLVPIPFPFSWPLACGATWSAP